MLLLAVLPFLFSSAIFSSNNYQTVAAFNEIDNETHSSSIADENGTNLYLLNQTAIRTQISLLSQPNSVAPGDTVSFFIVVSPSPPTESDSFCNITLLVSRPDGTVDLLGPFQSEPNGSKTVGYEPEMMGNYSAQAIYAGQFFASLGITYLDAKSPPIALTVGTNIDGQTPDSTNSTKASPAMILFGGGARWAAGNGTLTLYINWFDNYNAHYFTDASNWNTTWWPRDDLERMKQNAVIELSRRGFHVECAADVPQDISKYDLVIFEAWWAVEPKHSQLVREYLENGGNVVVLQGVPSFFSVYCKDWWPYRFGGLDLSPLTDWFGASRFANTGGSAHVAVAQPFGTALTTGEVLVSGVGGSCYSMVRSSVSSDCQVVALWDNGLVFAFTHEYGKGRVYYQATA